MNRSESGRVFGCSRNVVDLWRGLLRLWYWYPEKELAGLLITQSLFKLDAISLMSTSEIKTLHINELMCPVLDFTALECTSTEQVFPVSSITRKRDHRSKARQFWVDFQLTQLKIDEPCFCGRAFGLIIVKVEPQFKRRTSHASNSM